MEFKENLRAELHKMVDNFIDTGQYPVGEAVVDPALTNDTPKRKLPEGKRAVRTKSSGDRVYYLDEEKKTRQWVTNPEVLQGLGFESSDVVEIEDNELLKYQMSSAIYKVPDATT